MTVTGSFAEYLAQERPRADTVVQAARFYLALRTDDLPVEDMHAELREAADEGQLDEVVNELGRNPATLAAGAAALLSSAWSQPGGPEAVRNAFLATRGKLPVIEVGILAVSVMYGLYLLVSGSVKKSTRITVRRPDGTVVEYDSKEYFGPAGPLTSLLRVLPAAGAHSSTEAPAADSPVPGEGA